MSPLLSSGVGGPRAAAALLAVTVAAGGCSAGSEGVTGNPGGPTSSNAATRPAAPSASSTTTATGFKQDPVDPAFAKNLGALCNDWNSFASNHPYPGAPNPEAVTVEELPKISAWLDSLTMNRELVARATKLGTPATGQTAWARVLEDFAQYEKAVATAARVASTADRQAWQSAEASWAAARDLVREDLLIAGIGGQSSCSLPFIRPASHGG
jgi:hypothetical protein